MAALNALKRHANNPLVVRGREDFRTKVFVVDLNSIARIGNRDPGNVAVGDVAVGVIGHIQTLITDAHAALIRGDLPAFMKPTHPTAAYELALDATDATRTLPVELRDLIAGYASDATQGPSA